MQCPRCGADLLQTARFCKYCGHPITPPQPEVTQRQPVMAAQAQPIYTPRQHTAVPPRPNTPTPQGYQPMPQSYAPAPQAFTPQSQPEPRRKKGLPRWAALLLPVAMLVAGVLLGSLQSGGIAENEDEIPKGAERVNITADQMPALSTAEGSGDWVVKSDADFPAADIEHQPEESAESSHDTGESGEAAESREPEAPRAAEDDSAGSGGADALTPAALANIWVGDTTDEYGTINWEYGFDERMRYYRIAYTPNSGFLYYEQGTYTINGSSVHLEGTGYDVSEGESTQTPVSVQYTFTVSDYMMMIVTDNETQILSPGQPSGIATFA